MEPPKIPPQWPNALRWFLIQGLHDFAPWHLVREPDEMSFASRAFAREDMKRRNVLVFARRYDCDDFAGLEVIDCKITECVIWFHPVFGRSDAPISRTWDIICDEFDDVFDFMAKRVVPDMKDWAIVRDASDLVRDH